MADVVPKPKGEIAKVLLHEYLELVPIDMLVHVAVENEVGHGLTGLHQGGLILVVADRPVTDWWILVGNSTHPGVLGGQVELIPERNARLSEGLGSRTEGVEVIADQGGNKAQDPRRGDVSEHVAVWEGSHEDNTPKYIGAIIRCDVCSGNTTHGPTTGVTQRIQRVI